MNIRKLTNAEMEAALRLQRGMRRLSNVLAKLRPTLAMDDKDDLVDIVASIRVALDELGVAPLDTTK